MSNRRAFFSSQRCKFESRRTKALNTFIRLIPPRNPTPPLLQNTRLILAHSDLQTLVRPRLEEMGRGAPWQRYQCVFLVSDDEGRRICGVCGCG